MNLKKKLAIFDFDNTIKQHAPGFSTGGGMAEFFPDKKIPVEFFQVWKDQGFDAFCSTLISETNKLNISKEVLVKAVESDGELIKGKKPEQFQFLFNIMFFILFFQQVWMCYLKHYIRNMISSFCLPDMMT